MWPLWDRQGRPWPFFDQRGRLRMWVILPLFVLMTATYILIAVAVTLYAGLAVAAAYWVLGGFFLFVLALWLFGFLMLRRQEAKTR